MSLLTAHLGSREGRSSKPSCGFFGLSRCLIAIHNFRSMSTGAEDLSARLRALLAQLFSLQDPDVLSYLAAGLEEDEDVDADELR